MKIKIVTVGRVKENYFVEATLAHGKQIQKKEQLILVEVPDEKAPENLSEKEMIQIKEKEGERILSKLEADDFVICLAIEGKQITTDQFRRELKRWREETRGCVTFVIGGSLGLSKRVLDRSNYKLSFSPMTFPHQLMKVILLDQLAKLV